MLEGQSKEGNVSKKKEEAEYTLYHSLLYISIAYSGEVDCLLRDHRQYTDYSKVIALQINHQCSFKFEWQQVYNRLH